MILMKQVSAFLISVILLFVSIPVLPAFAETINYIYDDVNRLQAELHENGTSIIYSYDEVGNRTRKIVTAPVVITATAGSGGSISPSGAVGVNYGTDKTFDIAPYIPNYISDVKVDGISVGPVSSYSFSNVTTSHTIDAQFIDCAVAVNPTNQSFPQNGGIGTIGITILNTCAWTASSNSPWITITSGENGMGNGSLSYSVSASTNILSRIGTITVAGQRFTVSQAAIAGNQVIDNAFNGPKGAATYNGPGNGSDWGNAVAIQPDGKIVVAGTSASDTSSSALVLRYNADGTLDNTFGINGSAMYKDNRPWDYAYAAAIQSDGKILVTGASSGDTSSFAMVLRYNADGTIDNTFGTNGSVTYKKNNEIWNYGYDLAIQPDGKIVLAGQRFDDRGSSALVLRYNADGTLDNTFGVNGAASRSADALTWDSASAIAIQADGKIVVAGTRFSDTGSSALALRYNADGTIDNTFGTNGVLTYNGTVYGAAAYEVVIQPDGRIVVAGVSYDGTGSSALALRYNEDGTLDNTFGTNGIAAYKEDTRWAYGNKATIQPDGKIVIAGSVSSDLLLLRYNANGTSDNTFGSNGALTYNDTVDGSDIGNDVAVQPDGKIVVVGERMEGTKDDLLVIRISGGPTGQHSLSINRSGNGIGIVTSSETPLPLINCGAQCSAPYGSGVTVTLTAIADESSTFTGWSGSGCSGFGPCLITMDSEQAVTAKFEIKTFTVTPSGGINGALAPVAPQTVNYDEAISFVITPNAGYHIASVEGCGGSLAGNIYTTGAIRAHCTITAAFSISDISVHLSTSKGRLIGGLKVYAFTGAGSYTGTSATTGADGNATFKPETFSSGSYKFRLDYMGYQFWSATLNMPFNPVIDIVVQEETAEVSLNPALPGVKVYLFTSGGSYLSQNATTSTSGKVSFDLPVGKAFKFRADNLGYQYWSLTTTIAGGGTNLIPINIGGDAFMVTVQKGPGSPISGVKTYLFSQSGTYLGLTQTSDLAGLVKYDVTSGTFKLRADYMGYQFWSAATSVAADTSIALDIPHRNNTVTVNGMFQGAATAIPGIPVYVYNQSDTYLSLNRTTDGSGKVSFELPGETYKVRADYLGAQFWSQGFISQDVTVNIPMADAKITIIGNGSPLVGVPVYVFTSSGSYLGISGTTNSTGQKTFRLPAGAYKFRADYEGKQFWSPQENLTADVENTIMISTGGGSFALRVLKAANTPLSGIKCYVFNEGGPYLNMSGVTDAQGEVTFNLADGHYQFRIDYLGHQFWTDIVGVPAILNLTETINHRDSKVTTEGQLCQRPD